MIELHDVQTIELARITSRLPSEIDAMGYLDSLSYLAAHYRARKGDMEWQAALAGRKLK